MEKSRTPSAAANNRPIILGAIVIVGIVIVGTAAIIHRVRQLATEHQVTAIAANPPEQAGNFTIGERVPDFPLTRLDGTETTLNALLDGDHYVVINFHHPDCPCAQNCGRLVAEMMEENGDDLHVVGILPTGEDDPRVMRAIDQQYNRGIVTFPVYFDKDRSLRELFGAERTPEVWLLDKDGSIAYYGAPESTLFPGASDHRFLLREAVEALRAGEKPEFTTFMAIGCPID
ncbi:MAG: redoxin domain-containing protein [Candidatus Sumerlaeia bacterium]|nr:redoxin domain-containing protein [Candidatus Sumerlaeia bacterium]